MKAPIKRALSWLFRKAHFLHTGPAQSLLEILHIATLRAMNYGGGGELGESGEEYLIKTVVAPWFQKSETRTAFDVGANTGRYSLMLARLLPEGSKIYSFEPSSAAYSSLKQNISREACSNISLFRLGITNEPGMATLHTNTEGSGLASLYKRCLDHHCIEMTLSEEIEVQSIDRFCHLHGIDRIDFLKLDIEGNEMRALQGAARMISNRRIDIIQWEFGGCNIDSRTFLQDFFYLLKDDYVVCRLLPSALCPIEQYREKYEIFLTTNWCAISKRLLDSPLFRDRILRLHPGVRKLIKYGNGRGRQS
jgi:FkbM family methyltransferase